MESVFWLPNERLKQYLNRIRGAASDVAIMKTKSLLLLGATAVSCLLSSCVGYDGAFAYGSVSSYPTRPVYYSGHNSRPLVSYHSFNNYNARPSYGYSGRSHSSPSGFSRGTSGAASHHHSSHHYAPAPVSSHSHHSSHGSSSGSHGTFGGRSSSGGSHGGSGSFGGSRGWGSSSGGARSHSGSGGARARGTVTTASHHSGGHRGSH